MFKTALNYLKRKFGRKQVVEVCTPSVPPVDLDEAAKSFVEEVREVREASGFVENLDQEHFESLDKEADPLENASEIPANSVVQGEANVSKTGAMGDKPSYVNDDERANGMRQDRVKKCFQKQVDNQIFEMGDAEPSIPVLRRKSQRGK